LSFPLPQHARAVSTGDMEAVNRLLRYVAPFKYAKYLSSAEFSKLAVLLHDIPPAAILSVNRTNIAAIRNGEAQVVRENVQLILFGGAGGSTVVCWWFFRCGVTGVLVTFDDRVCRCNAEFDEPVVF
jgi:hypothetical protein